MFVYLYHAVAQYTRERHANKNVSEICKYNCAKPDVHINNTPDGWSSAALTSAEMSNQDWIIYEIRQSFLMRIYLLTAHCSPQHILPLIESLRLWCAPSEHTYVMFIHLFAFVPHHHIWTQKSRASHRRELFYIISNNTRRRDDIIHQSSFLVQSSNPSAPASSVASLHHHIIASSSSLFQCICERSTYARSCMCSVFLLLLNQCAAVFDFMWYREFSSKLSWSWAQSAEKITF